MPGLTGPRRAVTLVGDATSRAERVAIAHMVQRLSAQFSILDPTLVQRWCGRPIAGSPVTRPASSCRSLSRTPPGTGSG